MTDERPGASLDSLYQRYYTQLLRRAAVALRNERHASLSPASLVHEAWARLARSASAPPDKPAQFQAVAARLMRNILVDAARRRNAQRRGGPNQFRVTLSGLEANGPCGLDTLLDFDAALSVLGRRKGRLEAVAELHFFSGSSIPEVARELGRPVSSVERDVQYIRAFLKRRSLL